MAASAKTSNPNPSGDWLLVSRRRGGKHRTTYPTVVSTISQLETLTIAPPSPWTPSTDLETDPEREARLLNRIHSSVRRLEASRFYGRFISRLRAPEIQAGLARARSAAPEIAMVAYGIGSIESFEPPRLQLALLILVRRELGPAVGSIEVFDPVLSAAECAVIEALGCSVIRLDERGARQALGPTMFFMPHCEAALYDNLLRSNWEPSMLNRMVLLGNSFGKYDRYVEETGKMGAAVRYVLAVRKHVREVEMEEGANGDGGDDGEDGFFRAFLDLSWHFFELDDDVDMNSLGNE